MKKLLSVMIAIGVGFVVTSIGQTTSSDQQQQQQQEQSVPQGKRTQQTSEQPAGPAMGHSDREQVKDTSQPTRMKSGATTTNANPRTGKNQTTTVNKADFKSRHSEVFSLGRHPREFFVQRFGANHVRVISNELFVFVDGCWVAVNSDGFAYSERVICAGDPDFIEVE